MHPLARDRSFVGAAEGGGDRTDHAALRALGGRGDGSLVRHGSDKGQVTAVFDVPAGHSARLMLNENGIDDDGDLIFRRVQSADGRTKAYVNDQPISVQLTTMAMVAPKSAPTVSSAAATG